ncbi:MAG: acyl-CoA/acyl-ACP dehydrogenase [Ardenticatenaceae bacterium]|nr:acyl-CoA/acyl-ACP dehydrogenase [Ardenticatenaceae bacterium]
MDFHLSPELQALQQTVRKLVYEELIPLEVEVEMADGYLSPERRRAFVERIRPLGIHASSLPKSVGGTEYSWEAQVVINEEIGKATNALGWLVWAPAIVLKHANAEQIERFVRPAAEGKRSACYAVTEPNAGSDASVLSTTAVRDGSDWLINGEKWHVTSADVADFVVIQCATDPEIGDGNTLFFIDLDTPGIEVIEHSKYSHNLIDGHLKIAFNNVRVPDADRFGEVGGGLSLSKEWFLHERVLIAARCCGAAYRLIEEATAFAKQRVQFGSPISEYQMTQQKLADSLTELWAARLMTYAAAKAADEAVTEEDLKRVHAKTSMAKLYASEMANRVADHAVQIFGGRGYMRENVAERYFRELRVERIWEGTSEIQRIIIAYSLYKRGVEALIG